MIVELQIQLLLPLFDPYTKQHLSRSLKPLWSLKLRQRLL